MRQKSLFTLLLFLLVGSVFAQITGKVEDEYGPIKGAMVSVDGTKNVVETGNNGFFSLPGSVGDVVRVVNPLTLMEKTFPVKKLKMGVLKMNEKEVNLDVVVAFGKQKKENLTGAVSVVDSKALESRPVSNAVEALQGQVAGMNFGVKGLGGELGTTPSFNIRGTGTLGQGSSAAPLVLIDGVEGSLASINPQDIQSISVLKDAAASSIYGSRAAFGVILVTTKSGKVGRVTINYNTNFRWATPILTPKTLDSEKFAYYWNEARRNQGRPDVFSKDVIDKIIAYKNGEIENQTEWNPKSNWWYTYGAGWSNNDWYKIFYRDWSPSQEHNVSLNGGTEKANYYLSFNYLGQEGLMRYNNDTYDRYALNGKFTVKVTDWLKLNYNSRFTRIENGKSSYQSGLFYHNIIRRWPTVPLIDPNGYFVMGSEVDNLNAGRNTSKVKTLLQQVNLTISPLKGWNTYVNLSYKTTSRESSRYFKPIYSHDKDGNPMPASLMFAGLNKPGDSKVDEWSSNNDYYAPNIYSEYSRELGKNFFKVMAGFQAEYFKQRDIYASRDELVDPNVVAINATQGEKVNVSGGYGDWATAGFFGRLNYNYDERYLLEFNLRYDGTSRFLKDKRWNWYPSASIGWNIARESFWRNIGGFLDKFNVFKFRASYGQLGNQNTSNWYPFYLTMPTGVNNGLWLIDGNKTNTAWAPGMVSALLTWEKVATKNVGLDLSAFNNRLDLSLDLFERKTTGMVGPPPELPKVLGTNPPRVNNSDMVSKGMELVIGWKDNIGKDFSYSIRGNMTDSRQFVTHYSGNATHDIYGYYDNKELGEIWGFVTHGIAKTDEEMNKWVNGVPKTEGGTTKLVGAHTPLFGSDWKAGDIMYEDLNGDGKISEGAKTLKDHGDLKVIGNSTPRYNFGLDINLRYKDFDFRAFFQGTGKRDLYFDSPIFYGANTNMWQSPGFEDHLDYFRPADTTSPFGPNVDAYYPRPLFDAGSKNFKTQTRFLQNGAYIRLKNVQLGYTLPRNLMSKLRIDRLRIYVSAENVFTLTKMTKLFDPETPAQRSGWIQGQGKIYPLSEVFSTGLSITF